MKTHLRVLQLDLDVMCEKGTYDHNELFDYIVERMDGVGYDTVFIGISCEGYWELDGKDVDKTSKYLMFNPGSYLKANVLNANIAEDAINIIHDRYPTVRIMAWAPTIYSRFVLDYAEATSGQSWYKRASPFDDRTWVRLNQFFRALGRLSEHLDGVMLQDDMYLLEEEDISTAALTTFKAENFDTEVPECDHRLRAYKIELLDRLASHCFNAFRDGYKEAYPFTNKDLVFGRDYYEATVLYRDAYCNSWHGQSLITGVRKFDQVVIMAYYNMCTGVTTIDPEASVAWLKDLVTQTKEYIGVDNLSKVIFKLQTVRWTGVPEGESSQIPADMLIKQKQAILEAGGVNVGFYPAPTGVSKFNIIDDCVFTAA